LRPEDLGHRPAIGGGDEDPDHARDDKVKVRGVVTLPMRQRACGDLDPAGARHQLVEHVTGKVTQMRPRQRSTHLSIHDGSLCRPAGS
jgi:hypothetical protein